MPDAKYATGDVEGVMGNLWVDLLNLSQGYSSSCRQTCIQVRVSMTPKVVTFSSAMDILPALAL